MNKSRITTERQPAYTLLFRSPQSYNFYLYIYLSLLLVLLLVTLAVEWECSPQGTRQDIGSVVSLAWVFLTNYWGETLHKGFRMLSPVSNEFHGCVEHTGTIPSVFERGVFLTEWCMKMNFYIYIVYELIQLGKGTEIVTFDNQFDRKHKPC